MRSPWTSSKVAKVSRVAKAPPPGKDTPEKRCAQIAKAVKGASNARKIALRDVAGAERTPNKVHGRHGKRKRALLDG
jgi:hypothetical protein